MDLNKQAMSPARFADLHPDVPLDNATKHFRRLETLGCIELVEQRVEKGRVQNVFRAVQRALFDDSSWSELPPAQRQDITGAAFSTYIERVAEASAAGTLDARLDRHFTWTALLLDQSAWDLLIPAVNAAFWYSLDLRVQAASRMATSGERPIPVTVGLACFESPEEPDALLLPPPPPVSLTDPAGLVSPRLAKAMTHPLRIRILVELNKRPMTRREFRALLGPSGPSRQFVDAQFRMLESLHCIERVHVRPSGGRRGPAEYVYRALQRSLFDDSSWELLPPSLRSAVTGMTFTTFIERVAQAAAAGTLDRRDERHFTWTALHYDQLAWDDFHSALMDLHHFANQLAAEAHSRLLHSGAAPIPATIALACFESPPDAPLSQSDVLDTFRKSVRAEINDHALSVFKKLRHPR